jgi:16S rRNA (uracil1498-N3)-methyltransferase
MRRIHIPDLLTGELEAPPGEAHHARDVLRLDVGDEVEVFNDAGDSALGLIVRCEADLLVVRITGPIESPQDDFAFTIASALPKGARADWMIEKLSELGAAAFVPLTTARSVVAPEGRNKRERWKRLAAQAAKQARRSGVMRIEGLTNLPAFLGRVTAPAWYFSTAPSAVPVMQAAERVPAGTRQLTLLIGPEGGWTEDEIAAFEKAGLTGVSLGATILRIETAAVAAGVLAAAVVAPLMVKR